MRLTSSRARVLLLLVAVFIVGLIALTASFYINADTYVMQEANRHLYKNSTLVYSGSILDRNGILLSKNENGERSYNPASTIRKAVLHTLGDEQGFIATGVQKTFSSELIGYNIFWGINTTKTNYGSNLKLSIDANVCAAAYEALNGRKGCVGVYNYKTGEIICQVSTPTFDITNKPQDIQTDTTGKYDGIYVNKLLNGLYAPGSVFKVATAISALENIPDIQNQSYVCEGEYKTSGGKVICSEVHGKLSFNEALMYSCNSAFAQIAASLGADRLNSTIVRLGLTSSISLDNLNTTKGLFDVREASKSELGWAAIGQHTDMANPMSIMLMMGAIANGGTPVSPYFVSNITNSAGIKTYQGSGKKLQSYMSLTTANTLQSILRDTVVKYYGEYGFEGLEICAKTGTAEVGGGKQPHAWFAGFSKRDDFPYAFVVVIENGGGGYKNAAPVASNVLNAIQK